MDVCGGRLGARVTHQLAQDEQVDPGRRELGPVRVAQAMGPLRLYAVDVDPEAVRCAADNLAAVGGSALHGDLFAPLPESLCGQIDLLIANAGVIAPEPGFLELLRELPSLRLLGRPVVLGTSRKSTLGKILDLPPEERFAAAMTLLGVDPSMLSDDAGHA